MAVFLPGFLFLTLLESEGRHGSDHINVVFLKEDHARVTGVAFAKDLVEEGNIARSVLGRTPSERYVVWCHFENLSAVIAPPPKKNV